MIYQAGKKIIEAIPKLSGRPSRGKITQDDIVELKIALHTTKSIQEFLQIIKDI